MQLHINTTHGVRDGEVEGFEELPSSIISREKTPGQKKRSRQGKLTSKIALCNSIMAMPRPRQRNLPLPKIASTVLHLLLFTSSSPTKNLSGLKTSTFGPKTASFLITALSQIHTSVPPGYHIPLTVSPSGGAHLDFRPKRGGKRREPSWMQAVR
jgi:hypothetical protein